MSLLALEAFVWSSSSRPAIPISILPTAQDWAYRKHQWAELDGFGWPDGMIGSYTYRDGVMVEFVTSPIRLGNDLAVPPESLAALKQIQSSFTFFDDPYRTDRQLAALKVGQKLGGLTVTRIVPGAGGSDHPIATLKFAGQLTLTGHVVLPSPTMGGGWGGYFMADLDGESRSVVPQLKCPVEGLASGYRVDIRCQFCQSAIHKPAVCRGAIDQRKPRLVRRRGHRRRR